MINMQKMNKKQAGFTLIELVMVIVILGILSAFALPRFADLTDDARQASISGAIGAMKSASAITHAQWIANGSTGTTVELEGAFIGTASGYPDSASTGTGAGDTAANAGTIQLAANLSDSDYNITEGATSLTLTLTGLTCTVTYTAATGAVTTSGADCP
ncbi:type II secretion system protein [Alkalimarinus sediminis]|uniref:type II secretion system protein n=1 Tax=Alkalimarinus sediminis TaxID=1632866 RepID=UPI0023AF5BFF|nr:type II secretion system protein [Alkalimarinus sediminis]